MKKGDILWALALILFIFIMLSPLTGDEFIRFTTEHAYIGGFIKFFVLATMGELLAIRITTSDWKMPCGIVYRAVIWGFLGMGITLFFAIFQNGVQAIMASGLLPKSNSRLISAFFTSAATNMTFGPVMMAFHRVTDTYIDMKYESKGSNISLNNVIERIDWRGFISFVVLKTIPLFWIPAHTLTFWLPSEYRIMAAAMLSIALGAILAFAKKRKQTA
ncbi:hypothetical protein DW1_0454 [Proteiniborus sp. DW1]|nr:hypothetical protein DW1_0454 [Proteiniborus sp. DW1]